MRFSWRFINRSGDLTRLWPPAYAMKQLMMSIDADLSEQENFIRSPTVLRRISLLCTIQTNPRRLKTAVAAVVNRNVVGNSLHLNLLLPLPLSLCQSQLYAAVIRVQVLMDCTVACKASGMPNGRAVGRYPRADRTVDATT